jgi:hypothetical protein
VDKHQAAIWYCLLGKAWNGAAMVDGCFKSRQHHAEQISAQVFEQIRVGSHLAVIASAI